MGCISEDEHNDISHPTRYFEMWPCAEVEVICSDLGAERSPSLVLASRTREVTLENLSVGV